MGVACDPGGAFWARGPSRAKPPNRSTSLLSISPALRKQWAAEGAAKAAQADAARAVRVTRAATRHSVAVAAKAARKAGVASRVKDSAAAGTVSTAAAAARGAAWREAVEAVRAGDSEARTARLLEASRHWIGDDPAAIAARVEEALMNPAPLFPGDVPPKPHWPKSRAVVPPLPPADGA